MRDAAKDFADILAAAGLGLTAGSSLYVGVLPPVEGDVPSTCVAVLETGGGSPSAMNGGKAIYAPACQVRVRYDREDPAAGLLLAKACFAALDRTSPSPYISIRVRESSPFRLPDDAAGRPLWVFNVVGEYQEEAGTPPALTLTDTTLPASRVTVSSIAGLLATTAQAAFAELVASIAAVVTSLANYVTLAGAQTISGLKTFSLGIALGAKLSISGITNDENAIEIEQGRRISLNGATKSGCIRSDATYAVILGGGNVLVGNGGIVSAGNIEAQAGAVVRAGEIQATATSGNNGLRLTNSGRLKLSPNAGNDYWEGDGAISKTPGDVEITTAAAGVILKSPNGTRYKLTVSNAGALVISPA